MESRFGHLALEAIFPRFCLSCGREGSFWCSACDLGWSPRPFGKMCPFCETGGSDSTCYACQSSHALDGLSVYLPYGNPIIRDAISLWKYDADRSMEPILKRWITQSVSCIRPPFETFCSTHIPIHITRERSRGFDQAKAIATWVGEIYAMPIESLLVRTIKTKPQAKKEHEMRRVRSLEGIFSIHPCIQEIPKQVVLCDDVFTSGATMEAAAKCLKEVGVRFVWGFVLAKG